MILSTICAIGSIGATIAVGILCCGMHDLGALTLSFLIATLGFIWLLGIIFIICTRWLLKDYTAHKYYNKTTRESNNEEV